MAVKTTTTIKVPTSSGKTDPNVIGAGITKHDGSWNALESGAPSSAEQKARLLNSIPSQYEFGYDIGLVDGELVSTLYGRTL